MIISFYPPGSSVEAYLRDSSGEEQELSIEHQEAEIRACCADHGYRLDKIFIDEVRPGSGRWGERGFRRYWRISVTKNAKMLDWCCGSTADLLGISTTLSFKRLIYTGGDISFIRSKTRFLRGSMDDFSRRRSTGWKLVL